MNRIDKKFIELKRKNKKAFIAYLTVGYPNISTTEKLILELSKNGVDIFELGVPFSDPLADGPIIQESSAYALKQGVNLDKIFSLVKRLRMKIDNPLLIMGYLNPMLQYGEEHLARSCSSSGIDGVIIPDLPIEESKGFKNVLSKDKVHLIDFIAPTTESIRVKKIAKGAKGFIYYVSLTGVTGTRKSLPKDVMAKVRSLKRVIKLPICVGFGVSSKQQFKYISSFSDGVIMGSAIIKVIKDNLGKKNLIDKVVDFSKSVSR